MRRDSDSFCPRNMSWIETHRIVIKCMRRRQRRQPLHTHTHTDRESNKRRVGNKQYYTTSHSIGIETARMQAALRSQCVPCADATVLFKLNPQWIHSALPLSFSCLLHTDWLTMCFVLDARERERALSQRIHTNATILCRHHSSSSSWSQCNSIWFLHTERESSYSYNVIGFETMQMRKNKRNWEKTPK